MNGVVTFRTTINGLIINMQNDCEFESIVENLNKKVASAGKFFKGASLNVKYKGRDLSKVEEDTIHKLLQNKTGAEIKCFKKYTEKEEKVIKGKDKLRMSKYFFKDIEEGITKLEEFFRSIGLVTTLKEAGIDSKNFDIMAKKAAINGTLGSIKKLTAEDIRKIYEIAL
jgi:alcohol dehydrogenase YqhD (iron-dependent ADH family)